MKTTINYPSQGSNIAADLYLPPDITQPVPLIVMCHGFCGVKELLLPAFAEQFQSTGFAVIAFDYRGFGASEGEVGRLEPRLQIEDIKATLDFAVQMSIIDSDKIALWGTSFGGANAIVAATEDARVKCLAVQVTFGDGERVVTGALNDDEKTKLFASLDKMAARKTESGKEMWVPIAKVLSDAQSKAFYHRYADEFPALKTKIPFLTTAQTLTHKPEAYLSDLNVPLHITVAEQDGVNPPAESHSLFEKAKQPKALLSLPEASHYDVYQGELLQQVASAQIAWFKQAFDGQ
ncbi:MAG TPA: alpha/beta fold hydrolase [Marinagarivorans sp.]